MSKIVKVLFVIVSLIMVCALCFACVQVSINQPVSVPSESSSEAPVSSEDSSVETTVDITSEDTSEVSSEDSSEEPVSSEDSSEDSVDLPPVGDTEPVTPPPAPIGADEIDTYFNDSIFVGHSVMVHFKNYVGSWRTKNADILGDALFACTSSFSFFNNINQTPATPKNVLPRYEGVAYNIEDLPAATGSTTIYLGLMGLNDLGMVGKADTCAQLVTDEVIQTIEKIQEKNPDIKIVVLASTYLSRDKSYPKLNNKNMRLLNSYVLEYCNENGIDFVDIATPITDGGGYLASVYCSDNYCHLTQSAYYVWMDVLRDYARQKTEGTWKNPKSVQLFD